MSDAAGELAARLGAILEREAAAGRRQLAETHALTLEERVEVGEAVRGLRLVEERDGVFVLAYEENHSRFRTGDPLYLGDGKSIEDGVAVEFLDDDPVERRIRVARDRFRGGGTLRRTKGLVLDKRELDLTERLIDAVAAVLSDPQHRAVRDLLLGRERARRRSVEPVASEWIGRAFSLDPFQSRACEEACTRPFALVQGPPGTGKTHLAAAVVHAHLRAGRSVLCCAYTHRAVNRLLEKVAGFEGARARILKIGRPHQSAEIAGLQVESVPSARRLGRLEGPVVVGATTHAAAGLLGRRFDVVLLDEAGQVGLPHACAALALGRRHVLVGDHRQLRPLLQAEHADPLARRSVFEHLDERFGSTMLERTYRMNEALCAFPSRTFYGGRLHPADEARDRVLDPSRFSHPALRHEAPGLIWPMRHLGARHVAPEEARCAADVVADAVEGGVPPSEIAVVAPHRAQGNLVRRLLRERAPGLAHLPVVDTVERLQGGERDLVVLSLTGSDPEALLGEARFFFSPHRINVSITRARRKLVVLMSERILDVFPDDEEAFAGSEVLRRLWRAYPHLAE